MTDEEQRQPTPPSSIAWQGVKVVLALLTVVLWLAYCR